MNLNWFRRKGLIYIPVSPLGWLILLACIAYAVNVFLEIDRNSHSVSDTLINFIFNLLIIVTVYSFVAYLGSVKRKS